MCNWPKFIAQLDSFETQELEGRTAGRSVTNLPAEFQTTHWSLVLAAQGDDTALARAALAELCEAYSRFVSKRWEHQRR